MKVRYRGVVYDSIKEAAASTGANPVDLHLELVKADRCGADRFHTEELDCYIVSPIEKPGQEQAEQDPAY